jgi:phage tail-like protein
MTISRTDEPRFLTLNRKAAWDEGLAIDLRVDADIALAQTVRYTAERTIARADLGTDFEVTDFAVGQCNQLYILDEHARAIWIYDPNQQRVEQIEGASALLARPISITYQPGTLYIADAESEQRVVALAELNWQIRWTIGAARDAAGRVFDLPVPLSAADLTTDADGNLYALAPLEIVPGAGGDEVPRDGHLAIVKIDRSGQVVAVFKPPQLQLMSPTPLARLGDQVAIVAADDGSLYVLEATGKRVLKISADAEQEVSLPIGIAIDPSSLGIDTQGNLYIGDRQTLGEGEEDNRFIHIFRPPDNFTDGLDYRGVVDGYRGPVAKLVIDRCNRIYIFNDDERAVIILRPESTFATRVGLPTGYYFSRSLDSPALGTRWHKLVLDAAIPENTQIQVSCLVADERKMLIDSVERDLDAYLQDASLDPRAKLVPLDRLDWTQPLVNPTDALIRAAPGRYLWLRIILIGGERQTPELRSIRAYFPRVSYLRYLPAVYQEDARSRDFLERFLALFETMFAGLEEQIGQVVRYLDADVVAGPFLRWLAAWLAIAADANWTEEQLRALVKRAPTLYKKRGTREGIAEMIEIFTGERPLIVEKFQLRCAESAEVETLLKQLYGDDPYCFCVLLKPSQAPTEEARKTIRRIVEAEKPAYTCAGTLVLQPWIYLDMHTYLGVNTYLSMPSPRLDSGASMPRDTLLGDIDEAGQVERRARLAIDTTLT